MRNCGRVRRRVPEAVVVAKALGAAHLTGVKNFVLSRPGRACVLCLLAFLAQATGLFGAALDPHNPPQGVFMEEWMELHLNGEKAGYTCSRFTRSGETVVGESLSHLKIGRGSSPVESDVTTRTVETLDGRPVSVNTTVLISQQPTVTEVKFFPEEAVIVTVSAGQVNVQTAKLPPETKLLWGAYREALLRGVVEGTTYSVTQYSPDLRLDRPLHTEVKAGKVEAVRTAAGVQQGHRVETVMESVGGPLKIVAWVDNEGRTLRMEATSLGMTLTYLRVEKEQALADFKPKNVLEASLIGLEGVYPDGADEVRYVLSGAVAAGKEMPLPPQTDYQRVRRLSDGSVLVTVSRERLDALPRDPVDVPVPDGLKPYLEPSQIVPTDDPKLQELAQLAAGKPRPTDRVALADELRRFVSEYVTQKNMDVGFASASEVARSRSGDCSEHAVLLTALARINGIPSRVAIGLVYLPEYQSRKNVLGYHMWTQCHVGDRWVDLDAALHESECSPRRILLCVSAPGYESLVDMGLGVLNSVGSLKVRIGDPARPSAAPREAAGGGTGTPVSAPSASQAGSSGTR